MHQWSSLVQVMAWCQTGHSSVKSLKKTSVKSESGHKSGFKEMLFEKIICHDRSCLFRAHRVNSLSPCMSWFHSSCIMMWHGNTFCITGPLWGESTDGTGPLWEEFTDGTGPFLGYSTDGTGPLWEESTDGTDHLWGESTDGFPSQRSSDMELYCFLWCYPEEAIEQAIKSLVLMWCQCNDDRTIWNHSLALSHQYNLIIDCSKGNCHMM